MWHMLAAGDRYLNTPVMERPHLLAEITMRAFADRTAWRDSAEGANATDAVLAADRLDQLIDSYRSDAHTPPDSLDPAPEARSENPAATSFVVVDGEGMAVVCLFTMHNLFGTARVAPGTGIVLAAAPSPEGRGPTSLAALLMVGEGSNDVMLVAGAGGGTAAPSALISVILGTVFETKPLEMAMNRVRLQHGGSPDVLVIEPGFHQAVIDGLARRGHRLLETPNLGRVNAIYCPGGLSANPGGCGASTDIRGFGLAVRD